MDITNAVVFASTLIRNPALALRLVREFHPDRHLRTVKILVERENKNDEPLVLKERQRLRRYARRGW